MNKTSVLKPQKKLKFWGFILISENMRVTLPEDRVEHFWTACMGLKRKVTFTIRELAHVIGQLVAAFQAVQRGPPLFYRNLESLKSKALKRSKGHFEAVIKMSLEAEEKRHWWIENVKEAYFELDRRAFCGNKN